MSGICSEHRGHDDDCTLCTATQSYPSMGDDAEMDENEAIIPALREWGPDVSDPPDARTRDYIHPDLEREVMRAITRYPQSRLNEDGTTHGLAAVAAVLAVEQWLLAHQTVANGGEQS